MSGLSKTACDKLRKDLTSPRRNAWDLLPASENKPAETYAREYIRFLNAAKTEREAVKEVLRTVVDQNYADMKSSTGQDCMYLNHYGKSIALFRKGSGDVTDGLNIIVAHLDSPRLDIKPNPLYEDEEIAFLKTHYYGGVKKYQWLSRPLALHGVIILKDGTSRQIVIGEVADDPVFTIADLLPHLAGKAQMQAKASEFIPGEKLNIVFGSKPVTTDTSVSDRVKLGILQALSKEFGIREDDFISADLEIVPSEKAREVGLDRGLIAGYGQDDRVCSFAAMKAILDAENPKTSALILLLDKEEIGSEGATGANTWILEMVMGEVLDKSDRDTSGTLRKLLSSACCLSADVNAATHPDWSDVHEKLNAGYLNGGMVLSKFTGVKGKSGSNEANAEFIAELRHMLDSKKIAWHMAELGKVDEGGGGTIAKFMAYYGMNVIDAGVPVLDMHSPFEITSKADIWMMYKGFKAFIEK